MKTAVVSRQKTEQLTESPGIDTSMASIDIHKGQLASTMFEQKQNFITTAVKTI